MPLSAGKLISSTIDFKSTRAKTNISVASMRIGIFTSASYVAQDTKSMIRRLIMFNYITQAESDATPYPYWVSGAGNYKGPSSGQYRVFILVPNVNVRFMKSKEFPVKVADKRYIKPIAVYEKAIMVRCDCHDFRWRFAYYDKVNGALYGATPPPYTPVSNRGPVNPRHLPGVCKHTMASFYNMMQNGYLL
jgi:hypothetical protein